MSIRKTLSSFILGFCCLFTVLVSAAKPIFLITPTQKAPNIIYEGQTATAVYQVTNNTPYALNGNGLVDLPWGIKQTGGSCSIPVFNLGAGASCTLNLQITAAELSGDITGGPSVCNTPKNRVYCS